MPNLYRAPEIVLGINWNEKIDIWAMGMLVSGRRGTANFKVSLIDWLGLGFV